MHLKFIWIKEYGVIKRLGVNFNHGEQDTFSYDGSTLRLGVKEPNTINFGARVTGVTAVAGQNGSGKSSLSHIVLHSTATYTNGMFGYDLTFEGIVCYEKHIFYHEDLAINNSEELVQHGYALMKYKESPLENLDWEKKYQFASGGFIYYSNLFDFSSSFDGVNLKNISSTNQLSTDITRSTAHYYRKDKYDYSYRPSKDYMGEIGGYVIEENFRQVKYFLQDYTTLPFSGPNLILLKSTYSGNNRWLRFPDSSEREKIEVYGDLEDLIFSDFYGFTFISHEQSKLEIAVKSEQVKKVVGQLYRLNLLRMVAVHKKTFGNHDEIHEFVINGFLSGKLLGEYPSFQNISDLHTEICSIATFGNDFNFQPYTLYSRYGDKMEDWRFLLAENMYVPNTETGRKLMSALLLFEQNILNEGPGQIRRISNYAFPNFFSSGESAFLSLFSRLQDAIDYYQIPDDFPKKTIIIFIDEGDAGFHPKWNKMYLKWILDFLNRQNHEIIFQLIFSTHSPYLLSDLAPENVILLKRGQDNSTEIIPHDKFSTFGANIHELLSDSFFLEDGTVGEFAKIEINKIIDILINWRNLKNTNEKDALRNVQQVEKDRVWQLISIIGDDIVRGKLLEMYNELFQDPMAVQKEIAYLEQKIKNLRRDDLNP